MQLVTIRAQKRIFSDLYGTLDPGQTATVPENIAKRLEQRGMALIEHAQPLRLETKVIVPLPAERIDDEQLSTNRRSAQRRAGNRN